MRPAETYLQNYKNWAELVYPGYSDASGILEEYLAHCHCWSRSQDTRVFLLARTGQRLSRTLATTDQRPGLWLVRTSLTSPSSPPIGQPLSSAGQCVSSPQHSLALTSQTPFTNLNSTSSGRFIVIALPCLLFDKVISMRYPWIKVFKSAHEVPIYDFVARYRLWADGAASHKENIILWPSNNPTQMWL